MDPVVEVQRVVVIDDEPDLAVRRTLEVLERNPTRSVVIHTTDVDDRIALAGLVAGASAVVDSEGRHGRISIDGLVEAAGRVHPDDVPILGMLVHGTSPAEIGDVLGVHERELAGRRRRMLKALLGSS